MAVWATNRPDPSDPADPAVVPISSDEDRLRAALREDPDVAALLPVLDDTIEALDNAGIEYMLMGGIASSCMGRERWTHDIDLFARQSEALRALDVLLQAGFDTEETFADWLFKAHKGGQLVDIIFRSGGGVIVDSEMVNRAPRSTFMGREIRTVPPEDMIVIRGRPGARSSRQRAGHPRRAHRDHRRGDRHRHQRGPQGEHPGCRVRTGARSPRR